MQTATLERPAVESNRLRDFERYLDNQRFEEKTDIGERLGYHIQATLRYEMRGGAAYCLSDTKDRPFHEQTRAAMETGKWKFTAENAFEAERLRLEYEESLLVDALGRGELDGTVLVKVSKVPDAVVEGTASVNGYRRDLMRSFVRIYYKTPEGILCTLFSLDGNNQAGLTAVGNVIDMELASRGSEAVLADAKLLDWHSDDMETQVALLKERMIKDYDDGVYAETGKKTYAGSEFTDRASALQVIDNHPDLFEEHWRAVSEVQGRLLDAQQQEEYLEETRRKTAAAMKLREQGESVGSIGDESVATEAASNDYGRECATNGMNQTEKSVEKGKEIEMTCPFCGQKTKGDPCAVILECTKCGARVENGKVVSTGNSGHGSESASEGAAADIAKGKKPSVETAVTNERTETTANAMVQRLFGKHAILRTRVVVGNKETSVFNKVTGQTLARNITLPTARN